MLHKPDSIWYNQKRLRASKATNFPFRIPPEDRYIPPFVEPRNQRGGWVLWGINWSCLGGEVSVVWPGALEALRRASDQSPGFLIGMMLGDQGDEELFAWTKRYSRIIGRVWPRHWGIDESLEYSRWKATELTDTLQESIHGIDILFLLDNRA